MTTWQQNPPTGYYPGQQDPQQVFYGGQGYPGAPPQGYPADTGYPKQPGYPPQPGYPSQPGFREEVPSYPPPSYSTGGFVPPPTAPPYGHVPPGTGGPFASPPQQQAMYGSSYPEEPLTEGVGSFDFSDKTIRHAFIRKVYGILMCQLLITLAFIATFTYHEPTKKYVHSHPAIWWVAFVVMLVCLIAMACCTNVRRKAPMNFIFLFMFTMAEGFMLGAIASTYETDAVIMAVGITAAVCLGLTIFAFQTKYDFTVMGGVLFVAVLILMIFGIVAIFVHGKIFTLIYASLGALVFSVYLIYDTQLMLGGKHKHSISPEEYIFATLNLYLDIVNIFLYILTIIGATRD